MKWNHLSGPGRALSLSALAALLLSACVSAQSPPEGVARGDAAAAGNEEPGVDIDTVATRRELQAMEASTLERVRSLDPEVDPESAAGYAIFDATRGGFIVTGAGGTGLARNNETGELTYMHLGGGGVGLGAGLSNYYLLLVFDDQNAFSEFVDGQWSGALAGQAVAGDSAVAREEQSLDGVTVYRLSDEGLIAQADLTAIRFWPSEELNAEEGAA